MKKSTITRVMIPSLGAVLGGLVAAYTQKDKVPPNYVTPFVIGSVLGWVATYVLEGTVVALECPRSGGASSWSPADEEDEE